MNIFSINQTAIKEIERIFHDSVCTNPVLMLLEMADPGELPDDFKAALWEDANLEELAVMAKKHFEEVEKQLTYFLEIATYDQEDCQPEDLIDINGFPFVMAFYIREALQEYTLVFEKGCFLLKSADDIASNLRSVKTIAK